MLSQLIFCIVPTLHTLFSFSFHFNRFQALYVPEIGFLMTHIRMYSTQTTALTNEWTVCNEEHSERSLCISVHVIETLKKTQRNLVPNLSRIKKMVELNKGRDGKKKTVTRIPVFSVSGHQRASPSNFVRNFFCFYFVFPKPYSWKWSRNEFITSSKWWFWLNCTIGIYRNRISIIRVSLIKCAHFSGDRQRLTSLLSWALCMHPESYIVKLF